MARLKRRILKFLGPQGILNLGLRTGPYSRLSLRKLKKAPHGLDLGPLQPCLPKRLRTKDKRIHAAPEVLVRDVERLNQKFFGQQQSSSDFDLLLIGRRQLRSNNSWMHNYARLMKGAEQCVLQIHPTDAAKKGIADGDTVHAKSRVGSIAITARISDAVMQGVVCIPHGWGHNRPGVVLDQATQHPGASINDLTDDLAVDALCGTAAFNGTPVSVSKPH